MTRRAQPRAFGDAVRAARTRAEPATPLAAVQSVWDEAVGKAIAAAAHPVAERDGVVTVACTAATWAQELDLMGEELLARLSDELGEAAPKRLRFLTGDGRYGEPTGGR